MGIRIMPLFTYQCPDHGIFQKLLLKREEMQECSCGKQSKNVMKVGSVRVVDRLDNGLMARTVERIADIEEVNEQDAKKFGGDDNDSES